MSHKVLRTLLIFCISLLISQLSAQYDWQDYTMETSSFVNQEISGFFYDYTVYSSNGSFLINVTDQNSINHTLNFDKYNDLTFRAAYYKFIILQQMVQNSNLYYWILQVVRAPDGFDIQSFAVNTKQDNQGYLLNNNYVIHYILEYNHETNFLYVVLQDQLINIYGIDVQNQQSLLTSISRSKPDDQNGIDFIGGNSRVQVQDAEQQLWVDTRNQRNTYTDYTLFNKTNLNKLTTLPIYVGQQVFGLIDTYFQYVSMTDDLFKMTAFLYHGYGDYKIQGEINLISQFQIVIKSDYYNYFIAISDSDIYLVIIQQDNVSQNYSTYINTLQKSLSDSSTYRQTIDNFRFSIWTIYKDHKLYIMTANKFFVYGDDSYFSKLYETNLSVSPVDSSYVDVMFPLIKSYEQMPK